MRPAYLTLSMMAPQSEQPDRTKSTVCSALILRAKPKPPGDASSKRQGKNKHCGYTWHAVQPHMHENGHSGTRSVLCRSSASIKREVSLEQIQSLYPYSVCEAAARLGVGVTVLKKCCRLYSVKRWPSRKIQSVDRIMAHLSTLSTNSLVEEVKTNLVSPLRCCA